MTTPRGTPSGTDEVDLVAAVAKLLWPTLVGVLLAAEVLAVCPWDFFFCGGSADVSSVLFLFCLLATSDEPDTTMSDSLVTAQETNIIICLSRSESKAMKENYKVSQV